MTRAPVTFRVSRWIRVAFVTTLLCVVGFFVILPIVWLLISATKNDSQLFALGAFSIPAKIHLGGNISHAFHLQGGILGYWLLNSLIYSVVISVGATYLAALAGYAMAKLRFPGKRAFGAAIIGSLMVPSAVLVIPVFILEQRVHLTNTYEGVILPSLLSVFGVFFMMVYLHETLPDALIEAALTDGASQWRIFHRIALPIAVPGLVTLLLISFIAAWNNYFLPLVLLSNQKLFPVTVGLAQWLSSVTASSSAGATSVVYPDVIIGTAASIIPTLILFPFLQRFVARGITLGAVAGE